MHSIFVEVSVHTSVTKGNSAWRATMLKARKLKVIKFDWILSTYFDGSRAAFIVYIAMVNSHAKYFP